MNNIEKLREHIRLAHPGAITNFTEPARLTGVWSLEVTLGEKRLIVDWSATSGFGVTEASNENFGEGPDEILESLAAAEARVERLLTTAERTSPPAAVLLSRLRQRRGLTQKQLAERLGVRQATISGIERRDDLQLSTLRRVVEALGGELEVIGSFPEGRYRIEASTTERSSAPPADEEATESATDTFRESRKGGVLVD